MGSVFFISDTHFGHEKTCTTFKRNDGVTPLRPFANAQEMDEEMVRRWNEVVRPEDKVYHLGDVVIGKKHLETIKRLNGSKRLVRGNHDIFKTKEYIEAGFKEVYGVRVLDDNLVLSHVPLHRDSITQRWGTNVHGHLHANIVTRLTAGLFANGSLLPQQIPDSRYFNVSVEQIDYRPIELTELKQRIKQNQEDYPDTERAPYVHRK